MRSKTRALVTGGAGFIGAHLVRALVRERISVRLLDNLAAGSVMNIAQALEIPVERVEAGLAARQSDPVPLGEHCELMLGDIRDPQTVSRACADVDVVFHQAALRSVPRSVADPFSTHDVNVTGTVRVLEASRAAGVSRVVFASSSSVYGDAPIPTSEDQIPSPKSPYAASKLGGEAYCAAYSRVFGVSTISLRYFNVFGPWQDPASEYAAVIPKFIRLALQGEPVPVYGDGQQARDFTYVDNVVEANLAAADAQVDGIPLNIGAGRRHTLIDLIETIGRILGRRIEHIHHPPRIGDVHSTEADISRAQRMIGYAPRIDFETGLEQTIEAFREAAAAR